MKKLLFAAIGATVTLVSASPAFAQDVPTDLLSVVQIRTAAERNMQELTARTASAPLVSDEAVLGEQALPSVGFDAPRQVQLDMLAALRADAAKNRALGLVPSGPSIGD